MPRPICPSSLCRLALMVFTIGRDPGYPLSGIGGLPEVSGCFLFTPRVQRCGLLRHGGPHYAVFHSSSRSQTARTQS